MLLMAPSTPNQLRGKSKNIRAGNLTATIAVRIGDNEIESVITRRSAEEMELKVGDNVTVILKATETMIQK